MDDTRSLTKQLQSFSGGDREIAEVILREVLPTLHQIAVRELRRERYIAPLSPTELINEVWLRSLRKGGWQINSREHFYAIAALAMRRVLVDFARQRLAQRRGDGDKPHSLEEALSLEGRDERTDTSDAESVVWLVLVRERIQGVPITPIDPSQPAGTMPARVAASAPASGTQGAQPAASNALGNATNAVNNVSDQKKKAQGLWQSVQGAVQPH
jgi:hypothetical protein